MVPAATSHAPQIPAIETAVLKVGNGLDPSDHSSMPSLSLLLTTMWVQRTRRGKITILGQVIFVRKLYFEV